jgi:hypothetical protein
LAAIGSKRFDDVLSRSFLHDLGASMFSTTGLLQGSLTGLEFHGVIRANLAKKWKIRSFYTKLKHEIPDLGKAML